MKSVALTEYLPVTNHAAFRDTELPEPSAPTGYDILVRVEAISVNPVDYKIRQSRPGVVEKTPRVIGWDASGVVEAVGPQVTLFKPGDEVYYAGDITRSGTNARKQLVDSRIVGRKPAKLSHAEAAAMPLTTLTAWEALFDRLRVDWNGKDRGRSVLIIGGAGGVGSIAIQLAKLAGLVVIATASRPETVAWCRELGADHVVDHRKPLPPQLAAAGRAEVDFILNFSSTDQYWEVMAEVIRPQGLICSIVENDNPLDLDLLKAKSAGFLWEFMFTRAKFGTPDIIAQHHILDTVSELLDSGEVRHTLRETLSPINAANLLAAHAKLESGKTIGKLALSGW